MAELALLGVAGGFRAVDRAEEAARIRAENPDAVAFVDELKRVFGASTRQIWLREHATGIEWGERMVDRIKREGGLGIAVQASVNYRRTR